LFSPGELNETPYWIPGLNQGVRGKTCKNIIDSLILTYPTIETADKYYKEFWLRRKTEGNDSIVFEILKELKNGLFEKTELTFDNRLANDTVYNLIKLRQGPINDEKSLQYFEYLKTIGLHASAYNLLYESTPYEKVKWDREKLWRRVNLKFSFYISFRPRGTKASSKTAAVINTGRRQP
jgi:hypothetical protein